MNYVPDSGDLIWLNFEPQAGHEQAGRRPGLVLTPRRYNEKARLAIVCPITTRTKGYPFEVALPTDCPVRGVVLADQARSLDYEQRTVEFICEAPSAVVDEAHEKLKSLLGG